MQPRILLINPPIYDFSAYDFWLKPYGMLRAAGFLRGQADFCLFDFMDRLDPRVPSGHYRFDSWGRGEYYSELAQKPPIFADVRRQFRRFGIPRKEFQTFLNDGGPFNFAFIQTGMTYWYPGSKGSHRRPARVFSQNENRSRRGLRDDLRVSRPFARRRSGRRWIKFAAALGLHRSQSEPRSTPILGSLSESKNRSAETDGRLSLSLHLLFGAAGLPSVSPAAPRTFARGVGIFDRPRG